MEFPWQQQNMTGSFEGGGDGGGIHVVHFQLLAGMLADYRVICDGSAPSDRLSLTAVAMCRVSQLR